MSKENDEKEEGKAPKPPQGNFVQVVVVTTSGSYPETGLERTPQQQKIRVILEKAANKLEITGTNGWIALVGDRELNVEASYIENGLQGEIEIDYGPREGGGGCA